MPRSLTRSPFAIDWAAQRATCPRGQRSTIWKPTTDSGGHAAVSIRFAHADCRACPARAHRQVARDPFIRAQPQHEAL